MKFVEAIASGKNLARELVNERSDKITPQKFIQLGQEFAKENNLIFKSYFDTELLDNNLNLIYAVGKGSSNKPGMFCIEYTPIQDQPYVALIGKGVTFDTGGNNLKPTGYIENMFLDKGGACGMFAAFQKLVELKVQRNILLVIPLADNSIDGNSYKPSDVIRSHKGLTVEINNTDAEGRLILADAMSYAQSNYKIKNLIELSTLTGACKVALGENFAGLFTNSEEMRRDFLNNSGIFDEQVWELPLDPVIEEGLKGGYSDIVNSTRQRWGGATEAAEFLKYFVDEKTEWVHLDMAGVDSDKKLGHKSNQVFGSGFGVSTILNYFRNDYLKDN